MSFKNIIEDSIDKSYTDRPIWNETFDSWYVNTKHGYNAIKIVQKIMIMKK